MRKQILNQIKKIFIFAMIFTMAATIAACGKKTDNGTESSVTT